jgi:GTP cyclohydrolase I
MNKNGNKQLVDIFDAEEATWILNEPDDRFGAFHQDGNDFFNPAVIKTWTENGPASDHEQIESAVQTILTHVGEDPYREGLLRTPHRVARMYDELLAGYKVDPVALINDALFDVEYDEMIVVKDIEFFSMCEHHMLPFHGHAHVAYLPGEKIIGLSKIPRIVEMFARRLQVQERMTRQIAELIEDVLNPRGAAVVIEGSHMCSMMRGVKKEHPKMVTRTLLGQFKDDKETRREFLNLLV